MALQTANYVRRLDSENTPPTPRASTKSSKVRNGIQAASRRRRALTSGGPHYARHAVVHAKKRKTHTQSKYPPTSVRMDVPTLSHDVQMNDSTPVSVSTASVSLPRRLARPEGVAEISESTPVSVSTASISLPRRLARPEGVAEISESTLRAVAPELVSTHVDYILEGLECLGPDMLRVLAGVKAEPVSTVLPKELSIVVNDISSDIPTHMFAVFSSRQPATTRRRVTLFPVHNLVFAMHCANLPILATSQPALPECAGQEIKVPVVPLCIPAPEVFPQLSTFLYTKRIDHLLGSLLPCPSPHQLYLDDPTTVMPLLDEFAQKLAQTYTAQALLMHVGRVHGMWRNAIALGIADERLWCALDVAWEVLLTSLSISTGKPHLTTETA